MLAQKIYTKYKEQIGIRALVIALEGPLGVGKTTFTKEFAQALGVADVVVSPTFTLHEEYPQFDHIDLWRIEDPQELIDLGLERMIRAKRVIIIEWAEKARELITSLKSQATIIWIKIDYGAKENERKITYENISH